MALRWRLLVLLPAAHALLRPILTYAGQSPQPVISNAQRAAEAGFGFEGGRVVVVNRTLWLFTAEFQGWPVNANMRVAIWRASDAYGPWHRVSTLAASRGNGTSIETWNRTCRADDLSASPWAPFPVYDEGEERWHVHWVSYACDLSWDVRVGIGNIMGAASTVRGRGGIAGPYASYGVVIGPNASNATALQWGDLSDCAACHGAATPPVYCQTAPCLFDNGITGAAICTGPFALPNPDPSLPLPLYAAFVGLNHDLAWASSMRGPWRVGSAAMVGQTLAAKLSTPSAMYTENPVVSRLTMPDGTLGFVATFDTVSPSGGWCEGAAAWEPCGRGEHFGFGVAFSADGQFWSDGVDVQLPGGCRTPLGLIEERDGTASLLFTRRFSDCAKQANGLAPGSRGDAANGRSMCANLYAARFNVSWRKW